MELARRLELNCVEAHTGAGADVRQYVVHIEDSGRMEARGVNGGLVDLWLGLAGSDAAGKNARGKVPQEGEMSELIFDVQWIRVGKKNEAAAARKASEKLVGENLMGK